MPSRARQGVTVIKNKNPKKPGTYILISKKTGYIDVWIGNNHYYYSNVQKNVDPKKISIEKVIEDAEAKEQRSKGIIVIRRK